MNIIEIPHIKDVLKLIVEEVKKRPIKTHIMNPYYPGQEISEVNQDYEHEVKILNFELFNNTFLISLRQSLREKCTFSLNYQKETVNTSTPDKEIRDLLFLFKCFCFV